MTRAIWPEVGTPRCLFGRLNSANRSVVECSMNPPAGSDVQGHVRCLQIHSFGA